MLILAVLLMKLFKSCFAVGLSSLSVDRLRRPDECLLRRDKVLRMQSTDEDDNVFDFLNSFNATQILVVRVLQYFVEALKHTSIYF